VNGVSLFLGIALPESIQMNLAHLCPEGMRAIRLTKPEMMHITLHFLGETKATPILELIQQNLVFSDASTFNACPIKNSTFNISPFDISFDIHFDKFGCFGPKRKPTVLWLAPKKSEELLALHVFLAQILKPLDLVLDSRAYQPHITLARCRWRRQCSEHEQLVVQNFLQQELTCPPFRVEEFILFESRLGTHGREYVKRERFPLSPS